MLSSDRSELRADHWADHRHRPAAGAYAGALWDDAQPFDPDTPWDDAAAEALMSLCESEEGRLSRPATRPRLRAALPQAGAGAPQEGLDRAWLEAHLSHMAHQLKDALAQANPEPTLAALSGRLDTIEQRFCSTLGRVAQGVDTDALRAIETRVLDLTAQLEQARERLDRIGAMDAELRAQARKVEEAGAQRTSGLEKLLRDLIAEWREGEQRTASALQNIEEAVGQLGEVVDAMEASKPAPDLSVPPLTGTQLGQVPGASGALGPAEAGRPSQPTLYQATLDASDYAPKQPDGEAPAASEVLPDPGEEAGKPARAKLSPGTLRIMALRAKLRQSNGSGRILAPFMHAGDAGERHGALKRASLSVVLMAGAALVASAYYLYRSFATAAPASAAIVAEEGTRTVRQ
jgi:hypothetical protein